MQYDSIQLLLLLISVHSRTIVDTRKHEKTDSENADQRCNFFFQDVEWHRC